MREDVGSARPQPCRRFLQLETEPRRQTGRRAQCIGLLSGDNLMLEFDLVDAPTSTHRVHHGKPR